MENQNNPATNAKKNNFGIVALRAIIATLIVKKIFFFLAMLSM
jgi:hypothetical protein